MSDTPRRFKVGDYVEPVEKYTHILLTKGKTYLVSESFECSVQEKWAVKVEGLDQTWSIAWFKLAKNTIVKDIIKDL